MWSRCSQLESGSKSHVHGQKDGQSDLFKNVFGGGRIRTLAGKKCLQLSDIREPRGKSRTLELHKDWN